MAGEPMPPNMGPPGPVLHGGSGMSPIVPPTMGTSMMMGSPPGAPGGMLNWPQMHSSNMSMPMDPFSLPMEPPPAASRRRPQSSSGGGRRRDAKEIYATCFGQLKARTPTLSWVSY